MWPRSVPTHLIDNLLRDSIKTNTENIYYILHLLSKFESIANTARDIFVVPSSRVYGLEVIETLVTITVSPLNDIKSTWKHATN